MKKTAKEVKEALHKLGDELQEGARVARAIADQIPDGEDSASEEERERVSQLSGRQHEILVRLANGQTNKEIAAELGISVNTVKNHRKTLFKRLHCHDLPTATKIAVRNGLVKLH